MSHYPPITPHLAIDDVAAALEFYPRAFGATERLRLSLPDGSIAHAELELNGALVQVAITLSVDDVDAAYRRAIEAGATSMSEPADQFHGDRTAALRCPFGHKWILQKHLRDVSPEEAQQLLTEMMSGA